MKKKTFQVKAQGNSMYPILQDGDTVEYIQTPFHLVKLNDIILVYAHDILLTHRVIYKTKNTCITRGDNNSAADPAIQKGRVLAKVVRFKRNGVWYGMQDVYLMQSALYLHEIQNLETVLQLQKIPHVFLKGVLISLRYENAIPKRIYADCDVLVPNKGYKQVEKAFSLLGYKPLSLANTDSVSYFKKLDQQPEVNFVKTIQGIPVIFDVHFEPVFLMSRLPALELLYPKHLLRSLGDRMLSRSVPKQIKGFNYSLCSVPDQILYLALHIFHHNFTDSIRYQLLDAVIRKSSLSFRAKGEKSSEAQFASRFLSRNKLLRNDWKELARTIKEYRLEGYLYGVFILLKKYFKTPIPQSFFTSIRPSIYPTSPFSFEWLRGAGKLIVIKYIVRHVDIFSQDSRMKAGMERFILIFLLSPEPFWRKTTLFVHPEVLYTVAKLIFSLFSSLISRTRRHVLLI